MKSYEAELSVIFIPCNLARLSKTFNEHTNMLNKLKLKIKTHLLTALGARLLTT